MSATETFQPPPSDELVALNTALESFGKLKSNNLEISSATLVKALLSPAIGLVDRLKGFDVAAMKDDKESGSKEAVRSSEDWTGVDVHGERKNIREDRSSFGFLVLTHASALAAACALLDPTPTKLQDDDADMNIIFYFSTKETLGRVKNSIAAASKYKYTSGKTPGQSFSLQKKAKKAKTTKKANPSAKYPATLKPENETARVLGFHTLYKEFTRAFVALPARRDITIKLHGVYDTVLEPDNYNIPSSYDDIINLSHDLVQQMIVLFGKDFMNFVSFSANTATIEAEGARSSSNVIVWAVEIGIIAESASINFIQDWKDVVTAIYASKDKNEEGH